MFEWYVHRIEYNQATRKGICVYNADGNIAQAVETLLTLQGVLLLTLRTSTLNTLVLERLDLKGIDHLILVQDHPDLFTSPVVSVLHKALLPLCYGVTARPVTVSLISRLDEYTIEFEGTRIPFME